MRDMDPDAVGPVFFFLLLFGFILLMRDTLYPEKVLLIERGLDNPLEQRRSDGKYALRWGLATVLLGVALTLGLWPIGYMPGTGAEYLPLRMGPWLLGGFIPLFFGLPRRIAPPPPRPRAPGHLSEAFGRAAARVAWTVAQVRDRRVPRADDRLPA